MGPFPSGDARYSAVYAQEAAMVDAAELIAEALERSGMSQAELARALGIARSEVTARLRGERNITVRKLAETLHALDSTLELTARARGGHQQHDAVVTAFVSRGIDGERSSASRSDFEKVMAR